MSAFDVAFGYLLTDEGHTYVNHPNDSGGPTKFGITLRAYAMFLKKPVTSEDIENLTVTQAGAFFKTVYWDAFQCDQIKSIGVAVALFDSAVLYGAQTIAILAQKALARCGARLKFDGLIGDKTIEAVNRTESTDFIRAFHELLVARIDEVVSLNSKNRIFREGWIARADRLLTLNAIDPHNGETA